MNDHTCPYGDRREELLLEYLYEELDAAARREFDTHLGRCDECRAELDGFRTVRQQLAAWTPPTFSYKSANATSTSEFTSKPPTGLGRGAWDVRLPAWAQVAAALLFLGVSAGIANLNVHYDTQTGLTIRTGWSTAVDRSAAGASTTPAAPPVAPAAAATDSAPWRADLARLERELRAEIRPAGPTPVADHRSAADAETLRRVRTLIDESERKQQRDLALRVAEVMRDVDIQRRGDLTRISQTLGQMQNNTGMEVMKQRQLLNYLVSVSQK